MDRKVIGYSGLGGARLALQWMYEHAGMTPAGAEERARKELTQEGLYQFDSAGPTFVGEYNSDFKDGAHAVKRDGKFYLEEWAGHLLQQRTEIPKEEWDRLKSKSIT